LNYQFFFEEKDQTFDKVVLGLIKKGDEELQKASKSFNKICPLSMGDELMDQVVGIDIILMPMASKSQPPVVPCPPHK
jgi:hypothetical protein